MEMIDKTALVSEIEKRIADNKKEIERVSHKNLEDYFEGYEDALVLLKEQFLDTLEVKDVDLEKELRDFVVGNIDDCNIEVAKHFFELGSLSSNPSTAEDRGTAEEIIIALKRIESDYRIDLTKEIKWVRNKAQKGE